MLNYSSLRVMWLHKFVLLFQAYCPVAIETDRKNSRFHLKNGTLWGKNYIYQQEFLFLMEEEHFTEECLGENCICLSPCVY